MKWLRFTDATAGALWYLALVVILPTLSLVAAGLVWLWREGLLLGVVVAWLAVTLVAWLVFVSWPRKRLSSALQSITVDADAPVDESTLPHTLATGEDWSPRDREIFLRACRHIESLLEPGVDWERVREHGLSVIDAVADDYHGGTRNRRLRFTLPEALLLLATVADRYRTLVLSHVPFADSITLNTLANVAEKRSTIERGALWANRLRRGTRLVNPLSALAGELRDQFTNQVLSSAGKSLQRDLMRLLLQEVAQVAIELYGGRLKVSDAELAGHRSRALEADAARTAEPVEPLRVLLLGQVSAGKSSLVNALAESYAAETDTLPSTDRETVHVLQLDDLPPLHLIDMPGLDDDDERRRRAVAAAFEADLLIWVAHAARPARSPDAALHEAMAARFAARPERRPPPSLLVLTHVDRLSPRQEWSPPYALDTPSEVAGSTHEKKRLAIIGALESARRQIGLPETVPAIPVRLDDGPAGYNVDTVGATLLLSVEAASASQLNRRRLDRADVTAGWRNRLAQTKNLALGVGRTLWRASADERE